jgi:Fe-S-cluster containining protein
MPERTTNLQQSVLAAANRPEVIAAVGRVYDEVRAEIEQRKPVCQLSGRCCKFEEYGHRLYVSTLELAAFMAAGGSNEAPGWDGKGCPFQVGKLCGVHTRRPFGCRMYFCDFTAQEWQNAEYEKFHARLKTLHDELGVPYFYVEWRTALRDVFGLSRAVSPV